MEKVEAHELLYQRMVELLKNSQCTPDKKATMALAALNEVLAPQFSQKEFLQRLVALLQSVTSQATPPRE